MFSRRTGRLPAVACACATAGVFLVLSGSTAARTQFITDEFVVNTHTTNYQFEPSVAAADDGTFVVVWTSLYQEKALNSVADVFAQRFDRNGNRLGEEFRLNTYTTNSQFMAEVARGSNGDFIVVWTSFRQAEEAFSLFGKRFDPDGLARGDEFQLDEAMGLQGHPALAVAGDNVLALWRRFVGPQDAGAFDVFSRTLGLTAPARGPIFAVNSYTTGNQRAPAVAALADGRFAVAWESGYVFEDPSTQDGSGPGIFERLLSASGEPTSDEFQVHTTTLYAQVSPAVAGLDDGGFVVVWGGYDPGRELGLTQGVFLQRFDSNGGRVGGEVEVNPLGPDTPAEAEGVVSAAPAVASFDGGFVVVWADPVPYALSEHIFGRSFTRQGAPRGPAFIVNSTRGSYAYDPQIAHTQDNQFVVVWTTAGNEYREGYGIDPKPSPDGSRAGVAARIIAVVPECADANDSGAITASDALAALQTSVGAAACPGCVCDVNRQGGVLTSDALAILQDAVGLDPGLDCAPCTE